MYAGIESGARVADDGGQRLEAVLVGVVFGGHDEGGAGVVDAGSVTGGDGAVFLEGGLQFGQTLESGLGAGVLVGVEDLRDHPCCCGIIHRDDLGLELAGCDGFAGFLLAVVADLVLDFAGDAVFLGHVLGGDAHVDVAGGAPQAVVDHLVLEDAVAHAVAGAGFGDQVRGQAHVLHTTGEHDFSRAGFDGVGGHVQGFGAGGADHVERPGVDVFGNAGEKGRLAGRVLALTGLKDVAHDDFFDLFGVDAGPLEGFDHGDGAKLARRDLGQGAKITADGGTGGAEDHNLSRQRDSFRSRPLHSEASRFCCEASLLSVLLWEGSAL